MLPLCTVVSAHLSPTRGRRSYPSGAGTYGHDLCDLLSQSCWVTHIAVSRFCEGDQLLIAGGAHIQSNGQHFLECSHDEGGLDGIQVSPPLCLLPFLVLSSRLGKEVEINRRTHSDSERNCLTLRQPASCGPVSTGGLYYTSKDGQRSVLKTTRGP